MIDKRKARSCRCTGTSPTHGSSHSRDFRAARDGGVPGEDSPGQKSCTWRPRPSQVFVAVSAGSCSKSAGVRRPMPSGSVCRCGREVRRRSMSSSECRTTGHARSGRLTVGPRAIGGFIQLFETYNDGSQRDIRRCPWRTAGDLPSYGQSAGWSRASRRWVGHRRRGKIPSSSAAAQPGARRRPRASRRHRVIGIDAHLIPGSYLDDNSTLLRSEDRGPRLGVEHVVYMGVRSYSKRGEGGPGALGLTYVSVFEIYERGLVPRRRAR